MSSSYQDAGVDVTAGYKAVELMKEHVKSTNIPGVMSSIGGFGGLFSLDGFAGMKHPVLVSGTDGVGTKLKLAFLQDVHHTVGQDCVAMCANDVACSGAQPLFFLDYVAVGKNVPEKVADVVRGVADGCKLAGCALIGGETAEMPGFYPVDEYDLAGFCVGIVDKDKIIDGSKLMAGDTLIGLKSSGVHSNGFSLVRKVFDVNREVLSKYYDELGMTLGECLLTPTRIYVKALLALMRQVDVHGVSHITGGGFDENIPRMLSDGLQAKVNVDSYELPAIFRLIQRTGKISDEDMYGTFNMGVGMVIAVSKGDAEKAVDVLKQAGEDAFLLGELVSGEKGVRLC